MPGSTFVVGVYRGLLHLYPAFHRRQFGEEMVAVFSELQADAYGRNFAARGMFYLREAAGAVSGAIQEHWRALGGGDFGELFPTRRLAMRNGFRFPKATAVLMTIILGGVIAAIQKGENISASLPNVSQPVAPIQPTHSVLLGGMVLPFLFFYAVGLIGWAVLFAMRRSGVHRLEGSADSK